MNGLHITYRVYKFLFPKYFLKLNSLLCLWACNQRMCFFGASENPNIVPGFVQGDSTIFCKILY